MTRPWSSVEVEEKIPELMERAETAVYELWELADKAVEAERQAKWARAHALELVDGRNGEIRAARASTRVVDGKPVLDWEAEADRADRAWRNQQKLVAMLDKQLSVAQSLLVNGRNR